jgi:beta-glucanase (GH16 family)
MRKMHSSRAARRMRQGRGRVAWAVAVLLALLAGSAGCSSGGQDPQPDAPGSWHLVFQDGFTGSTLDTAHWATCYDWNNHGCTNAGNHESEWYLPGQVSVAGGAATLTAARRTTIGTDGNSYSWTSGMISTGRDSWNGTPKFTFTYGYVEAAVQIPAQSGLYPAFWLMPASRTTPPELDVAEFLGTSHHDQMTVHWKGANGANLFQAGTFGPLSFPSGYHVFALDWEKDSLTWIVDGVARYWVTDPSKIPNVPMEIVLDLAVGVPTQPSASVNSAQMKVEWVRVWQH